MRTRDVLRGKDGEGLGSGWWSSNSQEGSFRIASFGSSSSCLCSTRTGRWGTENVKEDSVVEEPKKASDPSGNRPKGDKVCSSNSMCFYANGGEE